jgi:RNA polymerase sigma-70 factor (ECF subfamily)
MTDQIPSADPLFLFGCRTAWLRLGDRRACEVLVGASQGLGEVRWLAKVFLQEIGVLSGRLTTSSGVSAPRGFMNENSNMSRCKATEAGAIGETDNHASSSPGADKRAAFEAFVETNQLPLIGFLYRLVGGAAAAEQIAAEVFVCLYRSAGKRLQLVDCVISMYRLASALGIKYVRAHNSPRLADTTTTKSGNQPLRTNSLTKKGSSRAAQTESREERVAGAIRGMPERQQLAVLLHKYQGLNAAQIAQVLQASETEVKNVLWRAYGVLCGRLKVFLV